VRADVLRSRTRITGHQELRPHADLREDAADNDEEIDGTGIPRHDFR
jgi:hypothetical protein